MLAENLRKMADQVGGLEDSLHRKTREASLRPELMKFLVNALSKDPNWQEFMGEDGELLDKWLKRGVFLPGTAHNRVRNKYGLDRRFAERLLEARAKILRPKYYKFVMEKDGKFYSYIQGSGKHGVEYKVGCPAEAPPELANRGYHLTCFDSVENALACAKKHAWFGAVLFECDVTGVLDTLPPQRKGPWSVFGNREDLFIGKWPEGTVMAKTVTLRRKVLETNSIGNVKEE